MMKWYVFDRYDCFDEFETVEAAAKKAQDLVNDEMTGVHIAYLTKEQFLAYCTNGDLKAAHAK